MIFRPVKQPYPIGERFRFFRNLYIANYKIFEIVHPFKSFRLKLHSSYARPAPKPTPANAGQALRLNRMTEKTTPKPRPRVDLTRRFERQRSHYKDDCQTRRLF